MNEEPNAKPPLPSFSYLFESASDICHPVTLVVNEADLAKWKSYFGDSEFSFESHLIEAVNDAIQAVENPELPVGEVLVNILATDEDMLAKWLLCRRNSELGLIEWIRSALNAEADRKQLEGN